MLINTFKKALRITMHDQHSTLALITYKTSFTMLLIITQTLQTYENYILKYLNKLKKPYYFMYCL